MAEGFSALADARYVALTTYRRDGRAVTTPIWPVLIDGALYVGTPAEFGKVKRLRHTTRVQVALCDFSGRNILGEWIEGEARFVTDEAPRRAFREALRRKYGWQYHLMHTLSRLRGRQSDGVVVAIEPR